jgi:hypothetical protein
LCSAWGEEERRPELGERRRNGAGDEGETEKGQVRGEEK